MAAWFFFLLFHSTWRFLFPLLQCHFSFLSGYREISTSSLTPRLVVDVLGSATFLSSELSLWSGILFALCKNAQQKILLRFASNFDHPFLVNLFMVTACRSQEGAELLKSFKVREKLAWKGFRHKCETRLKVVPLSFCLLKKVSQTKGSAFTPLHPEISWFSFFALSAIWAGWLLGHGSDLAAHQKLAGFMSFRNFPVAGQLWFSLHSVFG